MGFTGAFMEVVRTNIGKLDESTGFLDGQDMMMNHHVLVDGD